jgi:SAM-dependent methyltransferase
LAHEDVWGAIIAAAWAGERSAEIIERDDGLVMTFDADYFFAPFRRWDDANERAAMRFVRGRVLDVGCGGGRACLHLQERGLDVVGIDSSPGAVTVSRERGVHDVRELALEDVDSSLGSFDTVLMLGQNFGMLRSRGNARRLLKRLARVATPRGRIVAETFDPHRLDDPAERAYRERNVRRGRMPGQIRFRVRHRRIATPWFDWLQVSPAELEELLAGTGWLLSRTLGDGPSYVAIIDRV